MIKEIKVMHGPSIWSANYQQLIAVKLEIGEIGENEVCTLCDNLVNLFPPIHISIKNIKAESPDKTPQLMIAKLVALTCIELQIINCSGPAYYNSHLLGDRSYFAVFEYKHEKHGVEVAKTAVNIIKALFAGKQYHSLPEDLKRLKDICLEHTEGPSSHEIIQTARARHIPVKNIANGKYTLLGLGKYRKRVSAALSDQTGDIAVDIAGNKSLTKQLLADAMLPVPAGVVIYDEEELNDAISKLGFPLVTKPLNGHQGKCITTDITERKTLISGFNLAKSYSRRVIVEKYIKGEDYRFLIINYKLVAAAKRSPAMVTGDGVSTIQQLIDMVNKDPLRGNGHNSSLTKIKVDEITENLLKYHKRTLDTVLAEGETQVLKDTANLSTGGTAEDVTDDVHPENVRFAERAARIIGLDICGIDIVAPDVQTPFTKNGGAIIEANAAPGLRMHIAPTVGKSRKVGKAIIDMLFPDNSSGRIPLIAITGTNGKTTTCRLMAHVVQEQGYCTGFTTTEGIYINGEQVVRGDCSGPRSSAVVLDDPSVDFAVLECARGGILRSGLAFDQCDIGIVTNVAADHLGLKDIYTVEDMAMVKSVVPRSVKKDGYAILNASIDLVYEMRKGLECNVAFFSLDSNSRIEEHCKNGGIAAFKDAQGNVVIRDGDKTIAVEHVENIPVTIQGKAGFMIENVLPVALAGYVLKFPLEKIRKALTSFYLTAEQAPGRLNITKIDNINVMVDYAHNPHSIKAFSEFMNNIKEYKTGIITGVGDRRDEDIEEVGRLAATIYNEVIIRIDEDTRGRNPEEIISLIKRGIQSIKPELSCRVIPDIKDALLYALQHSAPESYIILNADSVQKTLDIVKEIKENGMVAP